MTKNSKNFVSNLLLKANNKEGESARWQEKWF